MCWSCWLRLPDPASAARLTTAQISAALKRAGRRGTLAERTTLIQAALRSPQLAQPPQVTTAGAAVVRALAAVITTLNQQIKMLEGQVEAYFREHPDAEIISSQPGLGPILGARVLAEFGDDPTRYASAKARKNYAATSPITRKSGKKKTVMARYVHNDRLRDALGRQAYSALTASPGARAYYDQLRARNMERAAATRQPPRRHPPRLPQNPHPLRRDDRLAPAQQRAIPHRRLTSLTPGMSPKARARRERNRVRRR